MKLKALYVGLLEERNASEAFFQAYWSHAEHIGAALDKMVTAARENGFLAPVSVWVDPFDIANLSEDVAPSPTAETFWSVGRIFFDSGPDPRFIFPYGVIPSSLKGEHDADDIRSGFTRVKDKVAMTTIEANVDRDDLVPLFERLLSLRKSYRVFWYLLHDHWEDEPRQFLVNESLNSPELILSHLRNHELDSLENGFVTLTAYHEEGATNLKISDHKRIVIQTYSHEMADEYAKTLTSAKYPETDDLASIDSCIHHWHYRHPGSRSRTGLVAHLRSIGFKDWKPKG